MDDWPTEDDGESEGAPYVRRGALTCLVSNSAVTNHDLQ